MRTRHIIRFARESILKRARHGVLCDKIRNNKKNILRVDAGDRRRLGGSARRI